jgi:magnesium transporter
MEDILNTKQRIKVEEYDNYIFVVLKQFNWNRQRSHLEVEQISFVFGEGFLISFQEQKSCVFNEIRERLKRGKARLREHGSDYLAYSLLDAVIDQYFVTLEELDAQIERVEDFIITSASTQNARELYALKRQMFLFRKVVWPLREAINHLLRSEGNLISEFTVPYLRDIYDHAMQVVDTVETLRDILSNMLDAYLSSLSNRMNEIMKVLTMISTLFIPLTFVTGFYGMNFQFMPELHMRWAYPITVLVLIIIVIGMLIYFRRKKWL